MEQEGKRGHSNFSCVRGCPRKEGRKSEGPFFFFVVAVSVFLVLTGAGEGAAMSGVQVYEAKRIRLLYAQGWIRQYQCLNAVTLKACFGWGGDVETRMITDGRVFFEAGIAELPNEFPNRRDELARYDVVAVNQFGYGWIYRGWRGDRYVPYQLTPAQQALLKEYVELGGGLVWMGGLEEAYGDGPLAGLLPVHVRSLRPGDGTEREGLTLVCDDRKHPAMVGIPWDTFTFPRIRLEASPKPQAKVLLKDGQDQPLIAVREAGAGKVLFFAPPWGKGNACEMGQRWRYAGQFWSQAVRWLAGVQVSPVVASLSLRYAKVNPAAMEVRLGLAGLAPAFRGQALLRLLDPQNRVLAEKSEPVGPADSLKYLLPITAGLALDGRYYLRVELLDGRGELIHRAEQPLDVVPSLRIRVTTAVHHYRRGQKLTVQLHLANHTAKPLAPLTTTLAVRDKHGRAVWTHTDRADLPPERPRDTRYEVDSRAWACGDYGIVAHVESADRSVSAESRPWDVKIIPARYPGKDFSSFVVSFVTNIKRDVFSHKYLVRLLKGLRVNCAEQVWYAGQAPPVDYFEASAGEGMACRLHAAVGAPVARKPMVSSDGKESKDRFCFNAMLADKAWREAVARALAEKCDLARALIPSLSDIQGIPIDEPNWGGQGFCYCAVCAESFRAEYGLAPPKGDADPRALATWHRFRNRSLGRWGQFYAHAIRRHLPGAVFDPSSCLLQHPLLGNFALGAGYLRDFSECADAAGTWGFVNHPEYPLLHAANHLAHLYAMLRPRGGGPLILGHQMFPPWWGDLSLKRLRKQSYLALGYGVRGVSYYPLDELIWVRPYLDEVKRLNAFYEKYGPLFVKVQRVQPRVAVLYSFTDMASRRHADLTARSAVAGYMALVHAGFPADIVYEEDVLEDRIEPYQALFLFEARQLPDEVMAKLARHIQRGKRVWVDSETKVSIPGARPLGVCFAEVLKDPQAAGVGLWVLTDKTVSAAYERLLGRLDEACAIERPLVTDHRAVLPFCLTSGKGAYLLLVNQDDDTGHRVTVRVNAGHELTCAFDLSSGERIPCEPLPSGAQFKTDIAPGHGRYLVALPDTPTHLTVLAERAGDEVALRTELRGVGGAPVSAALPLRISVRDPRGHERTEYGGYRAAENGRCLEKFQLAANDPEGTWVVCVEDLLTGKTARARFVLGALEQSATEPAAPLPKVSLAPEVQVSGPALPSGQAADILKRIEQTLKEGKAAAISFEMAEKVTDALRGAFQAQASQEQLLVLPFTVGALTEQRTYLLVVNPKPYMPNGDSVFLRLHGELWDLLLDEPAVVDTQGRMTVFAPWLEPGQAKFFELRVTRRPRSDGNLGRDPNAAESVYITVGARNRIHTN